MVGVPRSKGCRICVQRRVRCDQTRPVCNNCKKGNRPCPGYGQDLKFQDEGAKLRKRFGKNDTLTSYNDDSSSNSSPDVVNWTEDDHTTGVDSQRLYRLGPKDWDVVGLEVSKTQRFTFLGLLEGRSESFRWSTEEYRRRTLGLPEYQISESFDGTRPMIPDFVLSPNLFQEQLLNVFRESCFPPGAKTIAQPMRYHSKWLGHLPPLTGTNPLLDTAVRAVTLVHVGRLNCAEHFINESRPYYGKALRLLNLALLDPIKGMSNETLCATILLSFYEMFASDNNESWVRHAGGAGALMRMRGAARHRAGFDREILLAYRFTLIIEAFQQDLPCFLDEPEWREVSNQIHFDIRNSSDLDPDRRNVFDMSERFYQAMIGIPGLAADARTLWHAFQHKLPPPFSRDDLIAKLNRAREVFTNTFEEFEVAIKKVESAPTIHMSKDPVIGISFDYANTFISATYTGYWTVSTVINLCLQGLQSHDQRLFLQYQMENRDYALNVCRSSAYMLTSSFLGPFFLIFGLRVALIAFEKTDGPEWAWVVQKLFDIGDRHMSIAKHVPGFKAGMTAQELIAEFSKSRSQSRETSAEAEPQPTRNEIQTCTWDPAVQQENNRSVTLSEDLSAAASLPRASNLGGVPDITGAGPTIAGFWSVRDRGNTQYDTISDAVNNQNPGTTGAWEETASDQIRWLQGINPDPTQTRDISTILEDFG